MQKRRTALVAAICTLVVICVFAGTFLFSSMAYQTDRYKVTLPSEAGQNDDLSGTVVDDQPQAAYELPMITPENVQAVIETLDRPAQYTALVKNTFYLPGDRTSTWNVSLYHKNDVQRVERMGTSGSVEEIFLYAENRIYGWKPGTTTYWQTAAGTLNADMEAMIPSYRDICDLPQSAIVRTELFHDAGEPCVRISCGSPEAEFNVSLISGLLKYVKYFENGELVRMVTIASVEEEIAETLFMLPGTNEPIHAAE